MLPRCICPVACTINSSNAPPLYSIQFVLFAIIRRVIYSLISTFAQDTAIVNARALDNDTPLHQADEPESAVLLLEHGADVHAKNNIGWTPMDWAIYEKNAEIQELLQSRCGRCTKLC